MTTYVIGGYETNTAFLYGFVIGVFGLILYQQLKSFIKDIRDGTVLKVVEKMADREMKKHETQI